MERRFDPRFPVDLEIGITDLNNSAEPVIGTLINISESGICVFLPEYKAAGAMVKLDFADTVLYGQVAYAYEEEDRFRTGIAVERVLVRASDLTSILESLLGQAEPHGAHG